MFLLKKVGALTATTAVLLLLTFFLINLLNDCTKFFARVKAFFALISLVLFVLGALCFFILITNYYYKSRSEPKLAKRLFLVSVIQAGVFTAAVLARLFIFLPVARKSGTTLSFFWRPLDVYSAAGGIVAAAAIAFVALFLWRHRKD